MNPVGPYVVVLKPYERANKKIVCFVEEAMNPCHAIQIATAGRYCPEHIQSVDVYPIDIIIKELKPYGRKRNSAPIINPR